MHTHVVHRLLACVSSTAFCCLFIRLLMAFLSSVNVCSLWNVPAPLLEYWLTYALLFIMLKLKRSSNNNNKIWTKISEKAKQKIFWNRAIGKIDDSKFLHKHNVRTPVILIFNNCIVDPDEADANPFNSFCCCCCWLWLQDPLLRRTFFLKLLFVSLKHMHWATEHMRIENDSSNRKNKWIERETRMRDWCQLYTFSLETLNIS